MAATAIGYNIKTYDEADGVAFMQWSRTPAWLSEKWRREEASIGSSN